MSEINLVLALVSMYDQQIYTVSHLITYRSVFYSDSQRRHTIMMFLHYLVKYLATFWLNGQPNFLRHRLR